MNTLSWALQSGAGADPPLPPAPATPPPAAAPPVPPPVANVPAVVVDVPEKPVPVPPAAPPDPPPAGDGSAPALQPSAAADAEPNAHVKNALRSMRLVKSINVELPTTRESARIFFRAGPH